jgi:hypothetical protein
MSLITAVSDSVEQFEARNVGISGVASTFVNPVDFGATLDGVTDDTAAFQAALDYVTTNFSAGMVVVPSGKNIKLNGGLVVDTNKVGMNWGGAIVDCSGFGNAVSLFTIIQSASDVNRRPALNRAHPISGLVAIGPGKTTFNRFALLDDSATTNTIAGVTFRDGGCWGWATGVYLGVGCFFTTFENWDFAAVAGSDMGVCIDLPQSFNSGEKNTFINCRFGQSDVYLNQYNGNADTHFIACSFNFAAHMMGISGGIVYLNDCHIEGDTDTDYWFSLFNSNTALILNSCNITVAKPKMRKEIFYCDFTVTHGGVVLSNTALAMGTSYPLAMVGGEGRTQASNFLNYAVGAQPVISSALLAHAYSDFENVNWANEWILGGDTPPFRSNINPFVPAGHSLRFAGLPGQNNSAVSIFDCHPGQYVSINLMASVTGYEASGTFYATWSFLDKAGVVLIGGSGMEIKDNLVYSRFEFGNIPSAPRGTCSVRLAISFFGVSGGTPFGDIDNVSMNII